MPKIGRNDPCPCGSAKKYKLCCLLKDRAAEQVTLAANRAELNAQRASFEARIQDYRSGLTQGFGEADPLEQASNAVVDLVHAGRLDEAEQAARDLLHRYPEVHDGYDRLGMVYQAHGQKREAADCYRKVVEFVRAHPEDYDTEFETPFLELIAELDPPLETD